MNDWEEAVAFALGLPATELSTSYGKPAVKVKGKGFLYIGRDAGSFAVASPLPEKELLMETDPEIFWETAHYRGWPAILVRYGTADPERVGNVIARAWWDKAPKALRKEFGERP